jgi:hypothetical protein
MMPPASQAQQEQGSINALKSQYSGTCACAQCSNPKSAADALKDIKSKSLSHIMGHEQAHQSAAGGFGGGISIHYDSNGVAQAGEVPIAMPGLDSKNPENGVKDYGTIRSAALAPEDPSGQDMNVAAQAQSMIGQAQVLMNQKQQATKLMATGGMDAIQKAGMNPSIVGNMGIQNTTPRPAAAPSA